MTSTIVGGVISSAGDYIQVDASGVRSYGAVELRHSQPPQIPLTDGHRGEQVGEVLHIQQFSDSKAVRIVAVSDLDPDELEGRQLSMGVTGRQGLRQWQLTDGVLDHVALVERGGAMLGPITLLARFDVRSAAHLATLPSTTGWGLREILGRAHENRHAARVVHGAPGLATRRLPPPAHPVVAGQMWRWIGVGEVGR